MNAMAVGSSARRAATVVRLAASLALVLCASGGFASPSADHGILFAADSAVPRPVQEFAWRVIETRCSYQSFERRQRSFWAHDARVARTDGVVVYSITILSEVPWQKTEPPAVIEMTLVDDGRVRLAALKSSFIPCTGDPSASS